MSCNESGRIDPAWAKQWRVFDLDWNGNRYNADGRTGWARDSPMDCDADMAAQIAAVAQASNGETVTFVYRNGKALPWFSSVREKLENPLWWGLFMPLANCSDRSGGFPDGRCGATASENLYRDLEQTPDQAPQNCGRGVLCGEYVFNHMNESLLPWLLSDYFGGANGTDNAHVSGFFVDDGWGSGGPSEMDSNATRCMGMSAGDVTAMIAAWAANAAAWEEAMLARGKYLYSFFYGSLLSAPGWSWQDPQSTCASFMRANCGAGSPTQSPNTTLLMSFSRPSFANSWPLKWPEQDIAAFLLARGPSALIGYGWWQCATMPNPFERPALLDADFGEPQGYCAETAPGSGVFSREWTRATVSLDCGAAFEATFAWKP